MDPLHRSGQALRAHQGRGQDRRLHLGRQRLDADGKADAGASAPQRCAVRAGLSGDGPRLQRDKPPEDRVQRRAAPHPCDHLRKQHLLCGQQHRQEPLLSLRPDAPRTPLQQGQGAGLQQNRTGPPLQRRHRDDRHEYVLRLSAAGHAAHAPQHQLPRHDPHPPDVLHPRGRYSGVEALQ